MKGYNASHIKFKFASSSNIQNDSMKISVVNETTSLLRVENLNVSDTRLSCLLDAPDKDSFEVCYNLVKVGCKSSLVSNHIFMSIFPSVFVICFS